MAISSLLPQREMLEMTMLNSKFTTGLLVLCVMCSPLGTVAATNDDIADAVADLLANTPAEVLGFGSRWADYSTEDQELHAVYHEQALQPLWVSSGAPDRRATAIYDAIRNAADEGLDPNDYHFPVLSRYWKSDDAGELARLDLMLTLALVAWVNDVSVGRVHPREKHPDLFARAGDRRGDALEIVNGFRDTADPEDYLAALLPRHRHYQGLKQAHGHYRELRDQGGWAQVPAGDTLHPGDRDPRVAAIRRRLSVSGEFTGTDIESDLYDAEVEAAVRHFQTLNGLAADGVAGERTVGAMNFTVDERLRLIEMNMERWRWMDHDLQDPYVLVDIAGFDLQGVSGGEVETEMRVIVGKHYHESPIFSDHIKYIEFNPFWNLTPNIARHETVPKLRKEPGYLSRTHIRVFDGWGENSRELDPASVDWDHVRNPGNYRFRQDPGPWNALGTMKFVFPNKFSVYLHDTPNHDLFSRASRAFSHGCIRLSEPARLAEFILAHNDPAWGMEKIEQVVDSKKRTIKSLKHPMAVHITYETAWTDGEGKLNFAPDVYGRDAKLEQILY